MVKIILIILLMKSLQKMLQVEDSKNCTEVKSQNVNLIKAMI